MELGFLCQLLVTYIWIFLSRHSRSFGPAICSTWPQEVKGHALFPVGVQNCSYQCLWFKINKINYLRLFYWVKLSRILNQILSMISEISFWKPPTIRGAQLSVSDCGLLAEVNRTKLDAYSKFETNEGFSVLVIGCECQIGFSRKRWPVSGGSKCCVQIILERAKSRRTMKIISTCYFFYGKPDFFHVDYVY